MSVSSMSESVLPESNMDETVTNSDVTEVNKRPTEMHCNMDDVPKSEVASSEGARTRKRKKTRRAKRRKLRPYSRSWQDDDKRIRTPINRRGKFYMRRQPVAPYNTTQFLMDEHDVMKGLDVQFQTVSNCADSINGPNAHKHSRARDSSFSVDSEEEYFYSSPEDEGDFLSQEFKNTYEDVHAERLNSMSKTQLIQEFLNMEARLSIALEEQKKMMQKVNTGDKSATNDTESEIIEPNEGRKNETSQEQILLLRQEIDQLREENERLRSENEQLHSLCEKGNEHSMSSVDSESDSSSSSGSSGGSASSDEESGELLVGKSLEEERSSDVESEEMK